ncbi:choice-of-anchor J domain-containing protein [Kaistella sp. G5-32]|uniref:Choice-of-anchor J domain-containing protein n=1 Tax=Kaistella gelatinilytica TaxID=2787636 RepID=A0ABS0FB94_9FLAO|nr:choice-of-anchor J domain-containing protein [Kaistella gelatinilytica]MBF8456931.1 choice-of-anchor J domain-containing protein [Kaistella gelatinilytica]
MKKILLTCSLALGIFASAQFSQNFDASTATPAGWTVINDVPASQTFVFGTPPGGASFPAHSGANVSSIRYDTAAHDDYLVTPGIAVTAGVNDRLSFWVASYSSTFLENYEVVLGNAPTKAALTTVLKATSKAPNAWTKISFDLSAYVGTTVYVAIHAVDADQFYLYVDDVVSDSAPSTIPACTMLSAPANAATGVSVRPTLTWPLSPLADGGYKLSLGTTSGGTDVLNNVVLSAAATSYPFGPSPLLMPNTLYYAKVIAFNNIGDATGCTETTFTTGPNPIAPYCGPQGSSVPTQIAPITSFTLNGTTNNSDTTATTIGTYDVNQTFLSSNITVLSNLTTIPFSLTGIGIANNGWAMSVFVDWNNDGDFLDAGESYFNTTATIKRSTTVTAGKVTLTGTLPIPSGTTFGVKRVRVKYNFSGTTLNLPLTAACEEMSNGQVEDYAIDYKDFTLAVGNTATSALSVYPNPFKDVLNITDVKGVKSIMISDVSGRQVKTMKPSTELQVSDLKTGLYIVNLLMEDGTIKSIKAIKK